MVVLSRTANPVEWQESCHQERATPQVIRRWWLFAPLTIVGVVALVALTLRNITSPTRELAIYTIWILHAIVAARAIAIGTNAISREHTGQTWDSLVLTGVSARRILYGKWLAVLRHVAPWMLMLGVVRLAMLPIFMLAFTNRYAWRSAPSSSAYIPYASLYIDWVPWAAAVAVIMTVVLTMLEVLACTALGLACSAVLRRGWLAMIASFIIRFTPVILFAAFTRYEVGLAPSWRVLRFGPLALADSGSATLYQLVLPLTNWTSMTHVNALPGLFLAAGLLLLFLAVSLLVAWAAIRKAGALPEEQLTQRPLTA